LEDPAQLTIYKTQKIINMKKVFIILSAFIVFAAFTTVNKVWNNDDAHSQIAFTVKHLGISDVTGTFNDFDVKINSEKPDFSDAVVELSAKVASIDTRVEARDNHLKSADFFDAEKYPTIHFKSTAIKPAGKNKYKLTGDLTMHGITRRITVDMKYVGSVENAMNKKQTAGFQVTTTIDRRDFNLGSGFPPPMISNEVRIKADGEFIQD
jgi:polyisoprenoid-binding protein YceI